MANQLLGDSVKRRLASVLTGAIFALALTPVLAAPVVAASPFSFAVIGDMPYGAAQLSVFPQRIGQINADPDVQMVGHLGDIGGPPNCSDSYYSTIKSNFDLFSDPLLYTPGDNEWSDCSDASVGAANPLNRLAAIRQVFFPQPGRSLGQNPVDVTAQPGYPENVLLQQQDITVGMVHIVGPSNGLGWWSGNTAVTPEQKAEVVARTAADISLIRSVFATAKTNNSRAVASNVYAVRCHASARSARPSNTTMISTFRDTATHLTTTLKVNRSRNPGGGLV